MLLTIQEFAVYLAVDYTERHSQRPQSWLDMRIPHENPSTWLSITTLQDPQITQVFMGSENEDRSMERVEKKNQLDATECFIALIICSTCFGHFYAHHQELETI